MTLSRRTFTKASLLGLAALAGGLPSPSAAAELRLRNRMFVMDTWFWQTEMSDAERAALLAELGVRGVLLSHGASAIDAEALKILDDHDLTLEAIYYTANIEDEPSQTLLDLMKQLEGRGCLVTLAMSSAELEPSDWAGDAAAITQVEAYAEAAADHGLSVALYPHANLWLERVSDAVRLARRFESPHVGAVFNLYHYLATDAADTSVAHTLDEAIAYLKAVTINGARRDTADIAVTDAILPLDEGDYELRPFLRELVRRGYAGPIGLQGYGIAEDVPAKLERSVAVYEDLREAL